MQEGPGALTGDRLGVPRVLGPAVMGLPSAAGEDARIRLWRVPPEGLEEVLATPEATLTGQVGPGWMPGDGQWLPRVSASPCASPPGHTEKIYSLRFHPLAADVLASSSYDFTVRIWDLEARAERLRLRGHQDQVRRLWGEAPSHGVRRRLSCAHLPPDLWPGLESQRAAAGHSLQGWAPTSLRASECP